MLITEVNYLAYGNIQHNFSKTKGSKFRASEKWSLVLEVRCPEYRGGSNTKHSNIEPILYQNILEIGMGMVLFWNGRD